MEALLQNPLVTGVVTPFLLSLLVLCILRVTLGPLLGSRFAVSAAGVAFIIAYVLLLGVPPFLPTASMQKIFHLAVIGLVAGILIDATHTERAAGHALSYIFPVAAILWLGWRLLFSQPSVADMVTMLTLYAASILVLWRVAAMGRAADVAADARHALSPSILILVAAVGAGLIALFGASASLSQLALALAVAVGGYLLWHYVGYLRHGPPLAFGATGAFGAAGVLLVVIYVMALFATRVSRWALLLLALVFAADFVARRVALQGRSARMLNPVLYGVLVAVPAVAAVAVAAFTADTGSGY